MAALARGMHSVNDCMRVQRAAGRCQWGPISTQRVGEIFNHRLMPFMGESHRIRPATSCALRPKGLHQTVQIAQGQNTGFQMGRSLTALDRDRLSAAWIGRCGGQQRPEGPRAQLKQGARPIFCLKSMQRCTPHHRLHGTNAAK